MIFKTESSRVSKEIPGIGSGSGTRWALIMHLTMDIAHPLPLPQANGRFEETIFNAYAGCNRGAKVHLKFSCQGTRAGFRVQISPAVRVLFSLKSFSLL